MRFEIQRNDVLVSDKGQFRWSIVSDAGLTVAATYWRTWAEHICAMLNGSGEDHEPTPQEEAIEQDIDDIRREQRDFEDGLVPAPSRGAASAREYAAAIMQGEPDQANPNCDGAGPHAQGEVRRYPLAGKAAAILCWRCWLRENQYQAEMSLRPGSEPGAWPGANWSEAERYLPA
jgi:hypothetical protein